MTLAPVPSSGAVVAVTNTSAQFSTVLEADAFYTLVSDVALWIAQDADATATAGAGSMLWPAYVPLTIDGALGATVAVIRAVGDGSATLARLRV